MLQTLAVLLALGGVLLAAAWGVRVVTRTRPSRRVGSILALLLCVASGPFLVPAAYLTWFLLAGQPKPVHRVLAPGVTYERRVWTQPRKSVAHIVQLDLNAGFRFTVTAPIQTPEGWRTRAQVPTAALRELQADLLVNGSFFSPFHDTHLLDYGPHVGELTEVIGTAIGSGQRYGTSRKWVTFWCDPLGKIGFGEPPRNAICAVSGRQWLLRAGMVTPQSDRTTYSRTLLAVDSSRRHLWLIVADGKQPNYSVGMTFRELQSLLLELGASDAIELDGGGSSTLVVRGKEGVPELLSRPCHTKIPMRERRVANCLGVIFPSQSSSNH